MAPANDDDVLEAAFRKAARRIAAKPEPRQPDQDPRDRIFPGTMPAPSGPQQTSTIPRNRRPAKRKVSPFSIVVGLVLAAVASVLYISNVIAVSRLAAEIGQLEDEYQTLLNEQEMIRAQIARLSGLERIRKIAEEQYGMTYSDAVPGWITVDPARVEALRTVSQTAGVQKTP
jgi:cell division protein FtsL